MSKPEATVAIKKSRNDMRKKLLKEPDLKEKLYLSG